MTWPCGGVFEPRSHGRRKAATPLLGRRPSSAVPHRSPSSVVSPCGHAAPSFCRRSSSFVREVWGCRRCSRRRREASEQTRGALLWRGAAARHRARVLLPCGCGWRGGGGLAAALVSRRRAGQAWRKRGGGGACVRWTQRARLLSLRTTRTFLANVSKKLGQEIHPPLCSATACYV